MSESGDIGSGDSGATGIGSNAGFLSFGGSYGGSSSGDAGSGSGSDSGELDSAGDRWDASIHSADKRRNANGTWSRKRGRTANSSGGRNTNSGRKTEQSNKANIESLASILAIVHAGIASATKTPELALEDDDASALAQATTNVLVEFDIQPNPKVQAIVGLVMTAGAVYGPKVYMIKERRKEEREKNE